MLPLVVVVASSVAIDDVVVAVGSAATVGVAVVASVVGVVVAKAAVVDTNKVKHETIRIIVFLLLLSSL